MLPTQEVTLLVCVCVCDGSIWWQSRGHSTSVCFCICDFDGSMWCKYRGHSTGVHMLLCFFVIDQNGANPDVTVLLCVCLCVCL